MAALWSYAGPAEHLDAASVVFVAKRRQNSHVLALISHGHEWVIGRAVGCKSECWRVLGTNAAEAGDYAREHGLTICDRRMTVADLRSDMAGVSS